jgi:hypothetical protein
MSSGRVKVGLVSESRIWRVLGMATYGWSRLRILNAESNQVAVV